MSIHRIKIKNFRSIKDVSINAGDISVFVGCNDAGKSNILRALDMFFNSENGRYQFDWTRDFSGYAVTPLNKAKQIEITLEIDLPSSYSVGEPLFWKRVWRQTGRHDESIKLSSGAGLPPRSKAAAYLYAMRYEYVPAIKGNEYFDTLLASIHDMLDATVRNQIRGAASAFTEQITQHTSAILSELETSLSLTSTLELPNDLRRLFSELEFKSDVMETRVGLSQRGDGIKIRHIPIILKWLSNQANINSAAGKPKVETIWGFEEPENNLEIRNSFRLASDFKKYSSEIQIFLTTHSPVFYSEFLSHDKSKATLAEVRLDSKNGTEVIVRDVEHPSDVNALHSSMGFLDLLNPHIVKLKENLDTLEARLQEGIQSDVPTVFVEGPSDKAIIAAIIARHFPTVPQIRVLCSSKNGGGHSWVKDSLIAWHHLRSHTRAVGLFDGDDASAPSVEEYVRLVEKPASGRSTTRKLILKAAGPAQSIAKAGVKIQVAIEELCPLEVWRDADNRNMLEDRENLPLLYKFTETNISFDEWLKGKLPSKDLYLVARRRVKAEEKEKFSKNVAKIIGSQDCTYNFGPLIELASGILTALGVVHQ